jgi:peroxisomal membrane protein 4
MLFSIKEKLFSILKATWLHSKNLGLFVFLYKLIYLLLKRVDNKEREYHTFIAGFLAGYLIFGKFNEINRQVI